MITVSRLTKRFPLSDGSVVTAVEDVSFSVNRGEVFGLLGPNGAGKTTTLRMMLGLLQPSAGDSSIDGVSVMDNPDQIKRLIGFVSTSVGVYQWLTPREMLSFVADLYDVSPAAQAERIERLADVLDFREYIDRRCGVLSTGQKQRVNLARALMHDPPVMLLDEPTRGLDVVGSQVVFEYLQLLRSQKKAVIICTHRLDEAERFADRFGLLHQGRLQHCGTLAELQSTTHEHSLTEMFVNLLKTSKAAICFDA
ncbi:MAG: ATP-binding cassette domain-containing protein [Fuerstiella sp.]|nr:ATP-binding cassette domain-containing protein [Fuerstiella sp.]MCP4504878.1 ATP-binding cassette domain-containing protein [Fuerstiella sp.]